LGTDLLKNSALKFLVNVLREGKLAKFILEHVLRTHQVKSTGQTVPDAMKEVGAGPAGNWAKVCYACNQ
jgi:hypothetical protein